MKYQIGDDILVLHSNEEGKVVDFINDKMVSDTQGEFTTSYGGTERKSAFKNSCTYTKKP